MKSIFKINQRINKKYHFNLYSKKFCSHTVPKLKNFINGEFIESDTSTYYAIHNPATNDLISLVPETTKQEFDAAVNFAKEAFKTWKNVPITTKQRYMFDYLKLLKENQVKKYFYFLFL